MRQTSSSISYSQEIEELIEAIGLDGPIELMRELKEKGFELRFIPRMFMQSGDYAAEHSRFVFKRL